MKLPFYTGHPFSSAAQENRARLEAVSTSLAMIEFAIDGTIVSANQNFLDLMGYALEEIQGRHHRIFVDPEEAAHPSYAEFWASLACGRYQAAEYRRLTKAKGDVWIQATYNPVLDRRGNPVRVIKLASDISTARLQAADSAGQLAAISRSHAVIEFSTLGEVLNANENFCKTMGYDLTEIVGRHHSIFVRPDERAGSSYDDFWARLRSGEFESAEFCRLDKHGREVSIQASYNPIFDLRGEVCKIVKYATDVTERKRATRILSDGLQTLATGDLRNRVRQVLPGELDAVRQAYNLTVEQFSDLVITLQRSSGALRFATAEILSGSNDLAQRTTRQAAAIDQTSASMQALLHTVKDNSNRALSASDRARQVTAQAGASGESMKEAKRAMDQIHATSSQIASIVGLIDDIALQTNLLALNASVEAARAGEQGNGFAVVAVEVRRLAQSAAQASADVKSLIGRASEEISLGSKLIDQTSDRLAEVVSCVAQNGRELEEIATVSQVQADQIADIAAAIRQMDEMTQDNAALVEETTSAIEQTEQQASELDRAVDRFLVNDNPARISTQNTISTEAAVDHLTPRTDSPASTNTVLLQSWRCR